MTNSFAAHMSGASSPFTSSPFATNLSSDTALLRSCASYEDFKIKWSPFYPNDGNMHVITSQFGQGVLLDHEIASGQARVQLLDGEILVLPASQITLHSQHRVLSFQEFMAQQQQQMMQNSSAQSGKRSFKRELDMEEQDSHRVYRARAPGL